MNYPKTKKIKQIVNYHGTLVEDSYLWLETTNSKETKAWIEKQNKYANKYFLKNKVKQKIQSDLEKKWNYIKF